MKLGWLQDMDIMVYGGGAQLTDRTHFTEGLRRGHDIDLLLPNCRITLGTPLIISNATAFSLDLFQDLQRRKIPYIWFAHDYWPICKYRLYYPLAEPCHSCYLHTRWLPILNDARLIVWLSPLHREAWLRLCPELEGHPYHLSPSPVDSRMFRDLGQPRSGVIAVNSLMDFKGRDQVLQWALDHPQIQLTLVGGDSKPDEGLPANCLRIPDVPQGELNALYNRHETFLHLPESPMPFDRTVAEAYLAGCRIIGNELVGALSWPLFREGREAVATALGESPRRFWEEVEEAIG